MENHSASGFVFAWKSHNRKDYDKRINSYLLLRFKDFGKIFPEENEKISANDF